MDLRATTAQVDLLQFFSLYVVLSTIGLNFFLLNLFYPHCEHIQPTIRQQNVLENPHILDWFFTERTDHFVKFWLKESLGASWHWYRYDYVVQRGSIHSHGVTKLINDPLGLVN